MNDKDTSIEIMHAQYSETSIDDCLYFTLLCY